MIWVIYIIIAICFIFIKCGDKNGFGWLKYDFFPEKSSAWERVFHTPFYYGVSGATLIYLFPLISPILSIKFNKKWKKSN